MLAAYEWTMRRFRLFIERGIDKLPNLPDTDYPICRYRSQKMTLTCDGSMGSYGLELDSGDRSYELHLDNESEKPLINNLAVSFPSHVSWNVDEHSIQYYGCNYSAEWLLDKSDDAVTAVLSRVTNYPDKSLPIRQKLADPYGTCCHPPYTEPGCGGDEHFPLHNHSHQLNKGELVLIPHFTDVEAFGWELFQRKDIVELCDRVGSLCVYVQQGAVKPEWYHPTTKDWQAEPWTDPDLVRV